MPGPLRPTGSSLPAEDSFYDLLIDTLEGLDRQARGVFIQRFLKSLTQLELSESQSLEYWDRILENRRQLTDLLGRPVSLKTALVDVFTSANFLRVPILMEYDDLKKLQINAATDPLTGLYNRRLFEEYFDKELNRARRYEHHLALIVLDLHMFKGVNDRYGHPRGDQVLQLAANTLRRSMRTSDFAFRIGGDEFALLLPQSDAEQGETLGRRIYTNFTAAIAPLRFDLPLALDYGLAVHPQDGDQSEVLLRVADERLYKMKYASRSGGPSSRENGPPHAGPPPSMEEPPADQQFAPSGRSISNPPTAGAEDVRAANAAARMAARPANASSRRFASLAPGGAERRKAERISLASTNAHAQVNLGTEKTVRVLDISNGGVSLELEQTLSLGDTFQAVLRVPILPAIRVNLRRVYFHPLSSGLVRVGCSFVA